MIIMINILMQMMMMMMVIIILIMIVVIIQIQTIVQKKAPARRHSRHAPRLRRVHGAPSLHKGIFLYKGFHIIREFLL